MANNKPKDKKKKEVEVFVPLKTDGFYYRWLPVIFAILGLCFSFFRYILVKLETSSKAYFKHQIDFTTFFDGNPNIIAILGCICMLGCFLIIPSSITKKRKSGDGLGLMFMPLGLLGIFQVLCTVENVKDLPVGVGFGIALFIISALGTFKAYMKYVPKLCYLAVFVAFFLLLAELMPYCYNKLPFAIPIGDDVFAETSYFYISYFLRDVFLLLSYAIFADRLKRTYINMDHED